MEPDKLLSNLENLPQWAENDHQSMKILFTKLKKKKPKWLDDFVHGKHDEHFARIDCLACGNCCRGLGPRITSSDIERLSKFLKIKSAVFIEQYLRIDEDGDYVFQSMPCPFLGDDNYCFVYESRPKACREYPHTDRKRFYQVLPETLQNRFTCPVVYLIANDLQKESEGR